MLKIYHNPRCRKSREGLEYLREKASEFEIADYINQGISETKLRVIVEKTGEPASNLVRTQEDYYKKELKG